LYQKVFLFDRGSPGLIGADVNRLDSVDTIKKEVLIMGDKLNALQTDIKIILEEIKSIQLIQTPTPRPSTDDSNNATYLVINENKNQD